MAEIEAKRTPAAAQKLLADLRRDAKAKGFCFLRALISFCLE
jgi:hypothetical protein